MSLVTTAPSYVTGQVVTAAQLNALQDGIQAAWTAYTPALVGITLGNGVLDCARSQVGKSIDFRFQLTLGTTTTLAAGTNGFALPFAAKSLRWRFNAHIADTGVGDYPIQARMVPGTSTTNVELVYRTTAALTDALVTNTAPFGIGSTDVITSTGRYEAA